MWWKLKAAIHQGIALLPERAGDAANYFLQRRLGRLTTVDMTFEHLRAGTRYADELARLGQPLAGRTVFELGTGRHFDFCLALWLCGAERVVTADVHRYLQEEIVLENLSYLKAHCEGMRVLFGDHARTPVFQQRFQALLDVPHTLGSLLDLAQITYLAPVDTAHLPLPDRSVNCYLSYNVLEYIPPAYLNQVLAEGLRVLADDGLHLHTIDLSDWFAFGDRSISGVNFLRYSEREWNRYAGNRFMYQNRLRLDDYAGMLARAGYRIKECIPTVDEKAASLLKDGFPLDARYRGSPVEVLAAASAWVVASRADGMPGGTGRNAEVRSVGPGRR